MPTRAREAALRHRTVNHPRSREASAIRDDPAKICVEARNLNTSTRQRATQPPAI
ncbi:hypothetical protein [Streptomyces niveus]|uniref:hypothetical protein n=1 Tax=Streptomyces niveus TaxID=193462 RepID=UPI00342C2AD0